LLCLQKLCRFIHNCGAACLGAICQHYGRALALNRLREAVGTGQLGTTMLVLFELLPVLSIISNLLYKTVVKAQAIARPVEGQVAQILVKEGEAVEQGEAIAS
jgi:Peptidase C39 family/Biotin-lipoyl like